MKIAVIAHVYYPEIWPEIAAYLRRWRSDFRVHVTTTEARYEHVRMIVLARFPDAVIVATPNRGRDIAPFLTALPRVIDDGCELVCKVHTKRSIFWQHGDRWRRSLYKGTLGARVSRVVTAFELAPSLGILAPAGHLLPHHQWWGKNQDAVMALAGRLGSTTNLLPARFAAGSMFWARTDALAPLLRLGLTADDFPEETGQTDGTIAHAIERLVPLAARQAGYETHDMSFLPTLARPSVPWSARYRPDRLLRELRFRLRLRTRAKAWMGQFIASARYPGNSR